MLAVTLRLQKALTSLAQYLLKGLTTEIHVVPVYFMRESVAENTLLKWDFSVEVLTSLRAYF